jgi:hypothetical protein
MTKPHPNFLRNPYHCPECGSMMIMMIGEFTAFCPSDECTVLFWNPRSPDGGMSERSDIRWIGQPFDPTHRPD